MGRLLFTVLAMGFLFAAQNFNWVEADGELAADRNVIVKIIEEQAPLLGLEAALQIEDVAEMAILQERSETLQLSPFFTRYANFNDEHRQHGLHQYYLLEFDSPQNLQNLKAELEAMTAIESVDLNFQVLPFLIPDDPTYPNQWALNNTGQAVSYGGGLVGTPGCDIQAEEAWDVSTGSEDVTIAILDTGISEHEEFTGKLVDGWNFYDDNNNTNDGYGHGSQCGGIAAAWGNNATGVAGIAWGSKLMPVKVLSNSGSGDQQTLANAIQWTADQGAQVISMSLGWSNYVGAAEDACTYAHNAGTTVIAATGNGNTGSLMYPSGYTHCVAIGALSPCNERKSYSSCDGENYWGSNYGAGLDVLAPGTRIHTVTQYGGYTSEFNGTSSACPHAAGVVGLLYSIAPNEMNPDLAREILQQSAVDMYDPGWDSETGYGRLNAFGASNLAFEYACENNWTLGDVNADSELNILDIVITTNIITNLIVDPEICVAWAADYNEDDIVNILDIIQIISYITRL